MIFTKQRQPVGHDGLLWIGGYCLLPLICLLFAVLFLSGCSTIQRDPPIQVWDDMKHQEKFKAQAEYDGSLFADHRASRRPPDGTVAQGHMTDDSPYFTGMQGGMYIGRMPVALTADLIKQGQPKFNTYCTPCHDKEGMGQGIVPIHAPTWQPQNLTEQRIVEMADGDIFNVITNGRRSMPSYRFQVAVQDRWAIIAYLRVLQRAAHGTMNDVPANQQAEVR